MAHSVLQELGIDSVKGLGISKGPARKAGHERYFVEGQEISIKGGSLASHLLQQLQDEAHRFDNRSSTKAREPERIALIWRIFLG